MLHDDGKFVLAAGLTGTFGIDLNAVSLLQMLWFVKTFGSPDGLPPNALNIFGTGVGQANAFRIPQGMSSITDAMVGRIGWGNIVINSPVREIDQDLHGATVISESVTVRVRKVVVAFATTIQGFIRFQPILPPNRAQLQ
jgi:monoamine oxidase